MCILNNWLAYKTCKYCKTFCKTYRKVTSQPDAHNWLTFLSPCPVAVIRENTTVLIRVIFWQVSSEVRKGILLHVRCVCRVTSCIRNTASEEGEQQKQEDTWYPLTSNFKLSYVPLLHLVGSTEVNLLAERNVQCPKQQWEGQRIHRQKVNGSSFRGFCQGLGYWFNAIVALFHECMTLISSSARSQYHLCFSI